MSYIIFSLTLCDTYIPIYYEYRLQLNDFELWKKKSRDAFPLMGKVNKLPLITGGQKLFLMLNPQASIPSIFPLSFAIFNLSLLSSLASGSTPLTMARR